MYNYNPSANEDDGSCIPFIYGCMDNSAYNYNMDANTEDSTCIYSFIEISIHDITGRKIDIIKKGIDIPGYHSVIFDGSIYASGKYFVYLTSDNVKLSKPITLIK